ncbi:hypothetical protein CKO31_07830 [Thiohalocapsa halophila]|uniref:YqaJ viral recombinase domain-containing protein n=1 Tax=Thiohalocapsa halophila TaxID=69359 RepID=A0ABS1CGN7_9GAMM|nr:YqaJ viral recombinase family protein [Thiohalocapsa halophila]MBK1630654.1 hypothetical protein [Thiohalocapsa halophila]
MKILDISQRTSLWHAWRAKGITASESAVILGRSPYKTPLQLFNERIGFIKPEDPATKPCVRRGIAFEDHVRQGFEERHHTILLPLCVESTEHQVLRCSLDGLSDAGEPVELKVPTQSTYKQLIAQGEQATAYQLAWMQLQHQLYVTEARQGWLVFDPWLSGLEPLEFCVQRYDAFLCNELIPACLAFWEQLQAGQMPEPASEPTTATSFYF